MDQRAKRQRREQALQRLQYVWIATLLASVVAGTLLLWVAIDTAEWAVALPFLAPIALALAMAWLVVHRQSQLAAFVLLCNALATTVIRCLIMGHVGNLLGAGILLYVYFRGAQAAMDLAEMRAEESREAAV
jgi:membrane-associated HD superfamily phosphohydrolase